MKNTANNTIFIAAFLLGGFTMVSCNTTIEPLQIQKLKVYDEKYYDDLRAYKKSDHCISFGWYAAYEPIEGVEGYLDPASWGQRILGMPDSLDICSLWAGIPSNDPNSENYAPIAYKDMRFVREKKGTRFVSVQIVGFFRVLKLKDGTEYDLRKNKTPEGIRVYAQHLVDEVIDNDLDGVDLDNEPGAGEYLVGNNFVEFIKYIGQYFGPKGSDPSKLLIVDGYPPTGAYEYLSYFVSQAYNCYGASNLQSRYNQIAAKIPPEKFIVTENLGSWYEDGGTPFTEANGNTLTSDGTRMYSLEGMARWNPTQGRKGGFGAFYFGRDYFSKGGPYYNMRRCIQIANPSTK